MKQKIDIFPPGKTRPIEAADDPALARKDALKDRALIAVGLLTLLAELLPLVLLLS
ncbi:hypothetical protein HW571_26415 [Agrobacterium genomosp. 3]|uniref:hypothetical protein n=1 Tax=Rhizobium/Agrobacterium group TaxID=227290 RepID=UPI001CD901D3|nr:hypothetical protein [Rhizobium sp. SSA_523]MCA1869164.1 hypothetical protein [Agrobacterium tomkonis]MCA1879521.1 hypothetical protein [Agrobacterium tumefaciens]MCA1894739.1 hypothetical protein [Agrobacterium tomkonis]WKC21000.1 hypothetical protein QTJ18_00090 [Rhizobium sp. SSA_523]